MAERKRKVTYSSLVANFIRIEEKKVFCAIDAISGCGYSQDKYDVTNFLRHFRTQHPEEAAMCGLVKEPPTKKNKMVPKVSIAINKQIMLEACLKLIALHHLPFSSLEWEGMRLILGPISDALQLNVNRRNIKQHLGVAAEMVKQAIKREMCGKLIHLAIDSASRHSRHILGINGQYEKQGIVVIRTLGMIEVKQSQTAKFLREKVLEILQSYDVSLDQITSVTTDNGANMIAAVKTLQKMSVVSGIFSESFAAEETHLDDGKEIELLDTLAAELEPLLSLTRCASHTLQLAVGDVIKKNDPNIRRITDLVKETRKTKYCLFFEHKQASRAPLWSPTRWGGRFKMIESIIQQQIFYTDLAEEYKEVEITEDDWKFMKDFHEVFAPVYNLTNELQSKHVPLCDFYMLWLQAIRCVESFKTNPMSNRLSTALMQRLKKLRESKLFQAAIYLDPRFNFPGSNIFASADEKESIQNYIIDIRDRVVKIRNKVIDPQPSKSSEVPVFTNNEPVVDEMDDYLTQLFGSSDASSASIASDLKQQLHQLSIESRQPHHYDVWGHWLARKHSHPELYDVATVVLSGPSSQVSVERAFSALALILSDLRTGLSEEALQDTLLIKLNKDIFEKIIPTMYDWKTSFTDMPET